MAHAEQLIPWLLLNAGNLKLKIDQLEWIKDFAPSFSDVRIHITVGQYEDYSFGADHNHDLALVKATAEAIERAVLEEHKFPTSNGLAAHINVESAKRSAISELVERDAILCHFYSRTPFSPLNISESDRRYLDSVYKWHKSRNIVPRILKLASDGVLFVADGRNCNVRKFGFVLGAGLKDSMADSIASAAIEASRQVAHLLGGKDAHPAKSLEEFMKVDSPNFRDHGDVALDLDYASQIEYLFTATQNVITNPLRSDMIKIEMIESKLPELKDCPLVFARATSAGAQDLFLGMPTSATLNLRRIEEFAGRKLAPHELSTLPHPFN